MDRRVIFTSNKCNASMNPDKHPVKNRIVNSSITRISPWLLHITISATSKIYAEMPMDDSKFSAMKTSEKVPSDNTNAKIQPMAKKHITTSQ